MSDTSEGFAPNPFGTPVAPVGVPVPQPSAPPPPPPAAAPFVPTFRQASIINLESGQVTPCNSDYFATETTALYIAEKYGDGAIVKGDFLPPSPAYFCTQQIFQIRYTPPYPGHGDPVTPVLVNAGVLAAYYARNPEDQFPTVADKLILAVLKGDYGTPS